MKDKRISRIPKILVILAAMMMISVFSAVSAHAGVTTTSAAHSKYKSILTESSNYKAFGLMYLNNDSIPDLVAVGQTDDGAYDTFTFFINGDTVALNARYSPKHMQDVYQDLYYYPKKNIFRTTYTFNNYFYKVTKVGNAYDSNCILEFNRQTGKTVYREYKWYTDTSNKATDHWQKMSYTVSTCTLARSSAILSSQIGTASLTKVAIFSNTAANRNKYLSTTSTKKSQTITTRKNTYYAVYKKNGTFNLNASAKTTLSYSSSNTNVATVSSAGKIKIKGYGATSISITAKATTNYKSATKVVVVYVKPVKMTITTRTGAAGKFVVQWSRDTLATGYQLQYSTKSDFSTKKTHTCSVNTKLIATVSTGVKGRTYYVRVRAYKSMNGQKIYGPWSAVKKVVSGK